jgi:HlyD family secretion protein
MHMKGIKMVRTLFSTSIIIVLITSVSGCTGSDNDRKITASGTIETTDVLVSAKVGGQITALLVDEGATVKKGDTVAVIDRTDLDIQYAQARANASAAEAQYKLLVRGSREEDIIQAEASLKNARDDLQRMEELFKLNSVTQKQLDDAHTRYVVAQQNYEKLKRGFRAEEIDAAKARRDQALAQVDAIRQKIRDAYILSPLDGVVTLKSVEEGEIVVPNASIVRISRLEKVHLMIYVSELELPKVKWGQVAKVYVDAFPDKPFAGAVVYISPIAEFTPKNIQTKEDRTKLVFGVKIDIPNPDQVLKPGMPADAVLEIVSPTEN